MSSSSTFRRLAGAACAAAALAAMPAQAGRPLATDDAGTAEQGTCQIEGWVDRASGGARNSVVAPACGVAPGVELGVELSRSRPAGSTGGGWGLKWVPESARWAGGQFGLKVAAGYERAGRWKHTDRTVLALASWMPTEYWAVHVNAGILRDQVAGQGARALNLATSYSLAGELLVFAEVLTNSRHAVFGGTVTTVGLRRWIVPDVVGLDVTASRESGSGSGTTVGVGLGWYGIGR